MSNYYQLLGLTPDTATPEDIKANYRKLALKWHPDQNPNDKHAEEMFRQINEAYATLSDPERKAEYDRQSNPMGAFEQPFQFFSFTFDRRKSLWQPWPGDDISIAIELTFLQSLRGVNHHAIHYGRECDCPKCKGHAARRAIPCDRCHETGKVVDNFMLPHPCPKCNGKGAILIDPCDVCSGKGRVLVNEEIFVDIPCGVDNGSVLRTPFAGNGGHLGGDDGDLYTTIRLKDDSPYHREQQTLILKLKVPPETLILGGEVEVPLPLGGTQKQTIPPCSSNNWSFAIPGHGVPRVGSPNDRGLLLVVLEADFPSKLTQDEEEVLREYARMRENS